MGELKRVYSVRNIVKHFCLFPLRFLPDGKLKVDLWKAILARQNSVPLYLVVNKGDTAVQVGTPNFVTVKRYSNLVGENGNIVVIEADPVNADHLKSNLFSLRHQNVTIVNIGAWSDKTTLTLKKSAEYDGDHRFDVSDVYVDNDLRTSFESTVDVAVDTLDSILNELNIHKVNYLCVTVNGAELEVLKGAQKLLEVSKDVRVFSKGHGRIGAMDSDEAINSRILKHLKSFGYRAVITKGELSPTGESSWGYRDGDVFAWKNSNI